MPSPLIGLGDTAARFRVYIANRPAYADFDALDAMHPLLPGELEAIGRACGNGWRKVFNVYAKLLFALGDNAWCSLRGAASWQAYRDTHLLSETSGNALLFSKPDFAAKEACHIVMGKHYGLSLDLSWHWLDASFAVLPGYPVVLCPYFDYRQLTNAHIVQLAELLRGWSAENTVSA